jgi:hypothetical protein
MKKFCKSQSHQRPFVDVGELNLYRQATNAWFRKNLGDAMLADAAVADAISRFIDLYQPHQHHPHHPHHPQHQQHQQAGLYLRHESDGQLHCAAILYFTPDAHALAHLMGASACLKPELYDMGLIAGWKPNQEHVPARPFSKTDP